MIDSEYQLIEELTSSSKALRGYRGKRRREEKEEKKKLTLPYIETVRGSEYLAWYEYYGRPRRVVHNSDIERSLDRDISLGMECVKGRHQGEKVAARNMSSEAVPGSQ
jgi:hypothetical protein